MKNLTPEHMRCAMTASCPSIHELSNGRLQIRGSIAKQKFENAKAYHDYVGELEEAGEAVIRIDPALLETYIAARIEAAVRDASRITIIKQDAPPFKFDED